MINIAFVIAGSVLAAAPCESLKSLALPGTLITAAELVPAGPTLFRARHDSQEPVPGLRNGAPSSNPAIGLDDLPDSGRIPIAGAGFGIPSSNGPIAVEPQGQLQRQGQSSGLIVSHSAAVHCRRH